MTSRATCCHATSIAGSVIVAIMILQPRTCLADDPFSQTDISQLALHVSTTPASDVPGVPNLQTSRRAVTSLGGESASEFDGRTQSIVNSIPASAVSHRPDGNLPNSSPSKLGDAFAWESWTSPDRIVNSVRVVAVMAALSLAPALLLMTTCYIRLVVVLGLLRQALGSQQLPPQQVMTTLAIFLTGLIMWPVWNQVYSEAIEPYSDPEIAMPAEEAWAVGVAPIRQFMIEQIRRAGNGRDVAMFLEYLEVGHVKSHAEIPMQALLPAFVISELKVAFLIGFQIYLPFLILDLVVSSVTMSLGMVMVPPSTIALPLKLVMFVLVDGWHLVVQMLLMSFAT